MAFRVGSSAASRILLSAAGAPAGAWTIRGWFTRKTDRNTIGYLWQMTSSTGTIASAAVSNSGDTLRLGNQKAFSAGSLATLANDDWFYLAVVCSGTGTNQLTGYFRRPSGTSFATTTHQITNATPTGIQYGAIGTDYADFAAAALAGYGRIFTVAELERDWRMGPPRDTRNLIHYLPGYGSTVAEAVRDCGPNSAAVAIEGTVTLHKGPPIHWGGQPLRVLSRPAPTGIALVGHVSSPPDNGSAGGDLPLGLVPPAGMLARDLVVVATQYRGLVTPGVSGGGQIWRDAGTLTGAALRTNVSWCIYNGEWLPAFPVISASGGLNTVPLTGRMTVFRPSAPGTSWIVDSALSGADSAPPEAPYTMTAAGPLMSSPAGGGSALISADNWEFDVGTDNPIRGEKTVSLAVWGTDDDNTFNALTPTWQLPGPYQVRNTTGLGSALGIAYKLQDVLAEPGNASVNQASEGPDRYLRGMIVFAEASAPAIFDYSGQSRIEFGVESASAYRVRYSFTGIAELEIGADAPDGVLYAFGGVSALELGISAITSYTGQTAYQGRSDLDIGIFSVSGYRPHYAFMGDAGIEIGIASESGGATGAFDGLAALEIGTLSPTRFRAFYRYTGSSTVEIGVGSLTSNYTGAGPPHTIKIASVMPLIGILSRSASITIKRTPMRIVEQTTVTLELEFRDRLQGLAAPSSAIYWMHEEETRKEIIGPTPVPGLGQTASITIPADKLLVPEYENERVFVVVVKAIFGNTDQVTQRHEIRARHAPGT